MKCIIFILLVVNTYANPSGHCELSSNRCIEEDFLPVQDSRNCTTGTDPVNSTYKVCNVFETCTGPSEDYAASFFCNQVTDYGGSGGPKGAIEKACIDWKTNTFCESDSTLILLVLVGILVVLGGGGFLVYHILKKKADGDLAEEMAKAGSRKGKYQRLTKKQSRLYKFEP